MSLFSKFNYLQIHDFITGQSINYWLEYLLVSQYWGREQFEKYQNEKLRILIKHAYTNVPFYTELFHDLKIVPEDIQTKSDLVKLPIITKDIIKKSNGKHLALTNNKKSLIFRSSSGSTGEPFQFYVTKHSESFLKAAAIRGWNWMGYKIGDSYAKISMNPRSSLLKKIQDYLNNSLYLSEYTINE
jgi:phenylacetate-CoA ligase